MSRYARDTSVSTDKSRSEIERTLTRYGATQFAYAWQQSSAMIGFQMGERKIRMNLPLPDRLAREFTHTPSRGNLRHPEDVAKAWEQACRQRWRALALVIKAKLEAVEAGISTLEEEFLAHIALPSGQTVFEHAAPQIAQMYETGQVVPLLPAPK